jgi:Uma2 family endonuclease
LGLKSKYFIIFEKKSIIMELLVENWAEREMTAYELERGKPMPSLNHSFVQNNLLAELNFNYRKEFTFLPELTLEMPEKPNCVPDISIYPKMSVNYTHDIISFTEKPLIVIEIVSPTQSTDEIILKFERYFFAGIQSCWLVIPSLQSIYVYTQIGKFQAYNHDMKLIDNITNIQLELTEIFQ